MVLSKIAAVLVLCSSLVGCGSSKSSSPSLSGNWQVTAISSVGGTQVTGSATLQQSGSSVTGSATLSGSPCATTVAISGTITGTAVAFQLQFGDQPIDFTGTVNPALTIMAGNYIAPSGGCTNGDKGTWSANKTG